MVNRKSLVVGREPQSVIDHRACSCHNASIAPHPEPLPTDIMIRRPLRDSPGINRPVLANLALTATHRSGHHVDSEINV